MVDNVHWMCGSSTAAHCCCSDSPGPVILGVEVLVNGNRTKTYDVPAHTEVTFEMLSASGVNDADLNGDAVNRRLSMVEHVSDLRMVFQIEFSIAPNSSDRAKNL